MVEQNIFPQRWLMNPFFINLITVASKIIKHFNLLILWLVGGAKYFPSVSPMNKKYHCIIAVTTNNTIPSFSCYFTKASYVIHFKLCASKQAWAYNWRAELWWGQVIWDAVFRWSPEPLALLVCARPFPPHVANKGYGFARLPITYNHVQLPIERLACVSQSNIQSSKSFWSIRLHLEGSSKYPHKKDQTFHTRSNHRNQLAIENLSFQRSVLL